MSKYNPKEIEPKWQKFWEERLEMTRAKNLDKRPKVYNLVEFPYPSGAGLHVGHVRSYTALDVMSRKARMEDKNVLYPIGWDAFGLPTENYAIKHKIKPQQATAENIAVFKRQLKALGLSFDWAREINTTDPNYYRLTQWIFLQLFKKGLAYKQKMPINWCPSCKIGLANEEVVDGKCERCGTEVEQKEKEQWMLAITKYADRLIDDLETVDYLERIKTQQINWIGRSEGYEAEFKLRGVPGQADGWHGVRIFTTRLDTIWGVTYVAISPELAKTWLGIGWQASPEVRSYVEEALKKRAEITAEPDKTGIDTGLKAVNPVNGQEVPVWVADYVLAGYGTGAVMGVPAHDERDFEFAEKYNLPIQQSIAPYFIDLTNPPREDKENVKRRVVQGVIKHPSEDKILVLEWQKQPWKTFVIGGVEEGETDEEAIKREILEETGYKNFKKIRPLGWRMYSEWFANHKDENRFANTQVFYLELADEEKSEVSQEEVDKHKPVWVEIDKVFDYVGPVSELSEIKEHFIRGNFAYTGNGRLIDSGEFDGLESEAAKQVIADKIGAEKKVRYKLRDWVFSRQHYWGEPIPLVYCKQCEQRDKKEAGSEGEKINPGWVPVEDKDLPVTLPEVEAYEPTDTGESPLAVMSDWVEATCPRCGGPAKRETDTMPNWAGSSWYYLAYAMKEQDDKLAGKMTDYSQVLKYWMPVNTYNGGMEHTTLHLLYSRFWNKFLYDIGVAPTSEPYARRVSHGIVIAEDGQKMSKSRGNVINPDEVIEKFGADALRVYEMFMGPFAEMIAWNTNGLIGVYKFLERVWNVAEKIEERESSHDLLVTTHATVKKVSEDIEAMKFNTAVSQMMIFINQATKEDHVGQKEWEMFLKVLATMAPHLAEELWQKLGYKESIFKEAWPEYDEKLLIKSELEIVVQVNGKVRDKIIIDADATETEVKEAVLARDKIKKQIGEGSVKKVIYVPGKLVNLVI